MSPISSRRIVPPSAVSNIPAFFWKAPVKAPRSYPNSSLSTSSEGKAAQLSLRKSFLARGDRAWNSLAITSLPLPVSPFAKNPAQHLTRTASALAPQAAAAIQEEQTQEEQEQEEDIFNLIIGQEIGNQKDEVKGGGDNDLYNYSSSNEDELFKSVKKKYKGKRKR